MTLSSVATVKGGETLERSMTVLFSVKFSAYHRPNVKSNYSFLNTLKTSMGILWEAKGCLKSCLIIPNFSFFILFCCCCWGFYFASVLEGLHGERFNLFKVLFQLTSLGSPLWNGCINIYNIIDNDKKKIQQSQCKFELIMFTGWKWKFILYLNLLAAFIQAG